MRVLYPIISTGGGGDIYFQRLSSIMNNSGIDNRIVYYPHIFELFPFLLKPFFQSGNFDIIHSNVEHGFAFKKKLPIIMTVHHLVFDPTYQKYLRPHQKFFHKILFEYIKKSLESADKITAVSNYTKNKIVNIYNLEKSLVEVVYNGIDTEVFKPTSEVESKKDGIKLLFVGNPIIRKGFDLIPGIMENLDERFTMCYTSGLRTTKESIDSRIIPLGRLSQQELVEWYNKCDIFVSPSRLEGFGYSIAEAMSCGKPIVATNISSIPELVDDGKGGFLCNIDNKKDFAEKIKLLAKDENLRKKFGEYNRSKVIQKFNLEKMGGKYKKIYESFI